MALSSVVSIPIPPLLLVFLGREVCLADVELTCLFLNGHIYVIHVIEATAFQWVVPVM